MQMNRCFEIVYLLLERKKLTAQELADRFEVSVRQFIAILIFCRKQAFPFMPAGEKTGESNCGIPSS